MSGKLHEIRVATTPDLTGENVMSHVAPFAPGLTGVSTERVYRIEGDLGPEQVMALATGLFSSPLDGQAFVINPQEPSSGQGFEIGRKPGVMDPEAGSIMQASADMGSPIEAATTGTYYRLDGVVSDEEAVLIAGRLHNRIVEQVIVERPVSLLIKGEAAPMPEMRILNASMDELMAISKDRLFLDQSEMGRIQEYFRELGREPTLLELEIVAARLSEHCGHKTFNAVVITEDGTRKDPLFTRIKDTARLYFGEDVATAFGDNSGGIRFYPDESGEMQVILGKVETHNSPSAIEPYGGAMTGTGGVLRDIAGTGKGAKNLASTDMFCFAPPDLDPEQLPSGTLPPDYLLRNVVRGVKDYGNRMGVPTNNGSVHFHPDFRAKPSVLVGAYGIIPEKYVEKGKPEVGDLVVTIGGRTGRDGIHGATFSSGEMTDRTINVSSSAVQIGNAIEEKRMFDALLEARDADLIRALTDCGAAGFSSAVGEMGEETGVTVDVSKAPIKYEGLSPWEIWMSESQERMIAAISPENFEAFQEICRKHGVEAAAFGVFDGSNRLTVTNGDEVLADLDYEFLKHGFPQREMKAKFEFPQHDLRTPEAPSDWNDTLMRVMGHLNVASKERIVREYDQTVQGTNAQQPYSGVNGDGPNDAVILTPILGEPYGMVISHGMNPILTRIDPYYGSIWAVAEAMSNYVAAGGDPKTAALVNNFISPFPDEESMGSLDMQVDAVVDSMHALKRPVVSGKDSLSSTYRGKDGTVIKIPPVLAISVFGKIPDVEKTASTDIKKPGSRLVLVGQMDQGMAGSVFYDINGITGSEVPVVDMKVLPKTLKKVHEAIRNGKALAVHDVSEGGVIGAISEMAFGGDCGVDLRLDGVGKPEEFLFNETAGIFVVELLDGEADDLFDGVPFVEIGRTTEEKTIRASSLQGEIFSIPTDELKSAWQRPMEEVFA